MAAKKKRKATPQQLAALEKARAARAKKSRKTNPVPASKKTTRKTVKSNPINYGVKITAKNGDVGYLKRWAPKGPILDTLASQALKMDKNRATQFKNALLQSKFSNAIKSISVVSVHGKKK